MTRPPRCRSCDAVPFACSICHYYRCWCRPKADAGSQHYTPDGGKVIYYTQRSTRAEVEEYRELARAGPPRVLAGHPGARDAEQRAAVMNRR